MYVLVVDDVKLDDTSGDLGSERDDIGADRAIASPGRAHVGVPQSPRKRCCHRDCRESD